MAPKSAKKLIKGALADLSKENLEEFRDELLDRKEKPHVKRSKVEGKSSIEIADVLVSTFTEDGALAVVVELLKEIGCAMGAKTLEKEIGEQSSNPGPSDTVRPPARAVPVCTEKEIGEQSSNPGPSDTVRPSAGAEGGCTGADFVDKHRVKLIDRVSNIESILDELFEKEIITHAGYDDILAIPTKRGKMRELYRGPLHAAGPRGKEVFYKILEETEKCLVDDLKENK